ncbi:hypothetical protein M404DRAFT_1002509 [Pisolithus tinctorius Marx 270]|uniref:Uncharacterized protein n=1 Tax=Pisolithus tinctorius Marx 270 TaxID=870435 RepID=A0A0C3NME5_PISTI|nr:hypothetical protein M404DRAFT_1002509 [Pisolithus tinctorius Marx 270]
MSVLSGLVLFCSTSDQRSAAGSYMQICSSRNCVEVANGRGLHANAVQKRMIDRSMRLGA